MNVYTCGRVPSRALSHWSTYTLNLFSVFHYLALMYKSDPPQCCYYISIFANIWYLIKLTHWIIIILRVFMFYKQRVLANFVLLYQVEKLIDILRDLCFINSAFVPVASTAVHVTALSIWYERRTVCLCRPRCLFDLKSLLRRAIYKTLICARWL